MSTPTNFLEYAEKYGESSVAKAIKMAHKYLSQGDALAARTILDIGMAYQENLTKRAKLESEVL